METQLVVMSSLQDIASVAAWNEESANQVVAETNVAVGHEEAHLRVHKTLASTLAKQAQNHLHLGEQVKSPTPPHYLQFGATVDHLGVLILEALAVLYESYELP